MQPCPINRQGEPAPSAPLAQRYLLTRASTVALAAELTVEDQQIQVAPEASPTKWHLAHTTWFFERFVLATHNDAYEPVDRRYDYLFNSYYNGVGQMQPRHQRGLASRPTVAEVHDYRRRVDDAVVELLASRGLTAGLLDTVELGINHEQQHQELLLTDIKQVLFANTIDAAYCATAAPLIATSALAHEFRFQRSGFVDAGAETSGFAFDNERPRHREWLGRHALGNRPVTNAEYRQFIRDGGYANPLLWLADGWSTVRERGWQRPMYWSDDLESEYTLGGWRPIEPHAPVCHVSFYEAAAFAAWAGARLPSEIEWEHAAQNARSPSGNFLSRQWLHPAPAKTAADAPTPAFVQLFGDVWEWCASAYRPYPGYEPLRGALGEYNGKFMCNQLVVRGGSCVTPDGHVRATYRNFFYPHDRWQFLGLRLARDA